MFHRGRIWITEGQLQSTTTHTHTHMQPSSQSLSFGLKCMQTHKSTSTQACIHMHMFCHLHNIIPSSHSHLLSHQHTNTLFVSGQSDRRPLSAQHGGGSLELPCVPKESIINHPVAVTTEEGLRLAHVLECRGIPGNHQGTDRSV